MHRRLRSRHVIAFASCGAVLAALALPVSPASAVTLPPPELEVGGSVSFSTTSGHACSRVGTEPSVPAAFSHGTASQSTSMDITVTNTDPVTPDPADTSHATGHVSATGKVKERHGSLVSYSLTGTGKVSVTKAEGAASQCDTTANMTADVLAYFNAHKSGWLYLTRSQVKGIATETILESEAGSEPYFSLFSGPKSKNTERVFLKPGVYLSISAFIISSDTGQFFKAPPVATLSGAFHTAGAALGKAKGSASKYVAFPGTVTCARHSATLRWKSSASHVASGSFSVNGQKKGSDGNPRSGGKIVLRHLSSTADLKVSAKLSLKGGGSAVATSAYVPCKG